MIRPWKQAARSLVRRPGFAVAAIAILGAGIAATTGVFSIVDATVLRPLPYPEPDRLVLVMEANSAKSEATGLLAPGRLEDWNRRNRTFVAISGSYAENVTETSGDVPERLASRRTSPRFFAVYGVRPTVGRTFTADEEVAGGPAAAVISDHLWERRYQRRPDVVGQRLLLKGQSYPIVGVMPRPFAPNGIDLWIPAQPSPKLLHRAASYNSSLADAAAFVLGFVSPQSLSLDRRTRTSAASTATATRPNRGRAAMARNVSGMPWAVGCPTTERYLLNSRSTLVDALVSFPVLQPSLGASVLPHHPPNAAPAFVRLCGANQLQLLVRHLEQPHVAEGGFGTSTTEEGRRTAGRVVRTL